MREIQGNLWDYLEKPHHNLCITTNGTLKRNGEIVMGRGCALEAKQRFPEFPKRVGELVKAYGNTLWGVELRKGERCYTLYAFPVKHNWWEQADLELINAMSLRLKTLAELDKDIFYVLPRPGCGNGRLKWADVKPVIETILPDNVWVITHLT